MTEDGGKMEPFMVKSVHALRAFVRLLVIAGRLYKKLNN
jgi:hypothetical protein